MFWRVVLVVSFGDARRSDLTVHLRWAVAETRSPTAAGKRPRCPGVASVDANRPAPATQGRGGLRLRALPYFVWVQADNARLRVSCPGGAGQLAASSTGGAEAAASHNGHSEAQPAQRRLTCSVRSAMPGLQLMNSGSQTLPSARTRVLPGLNVRLSAVAVAVHVCSPVAVQLSPVLLKPVATVCCGPCCLTNTFTAHRSPATHSIVPVTRIWNGLTSTALSMVTVPAGACASAGWR